MLADTLTAKERESLEEKEETGGEGEKGQEEDEKEVKEEKSEDEEEGGDKGKEEELEELKAQVLQLLLELEDTREVSQRHEESFMELQGEETSLCFIFMVVTPSASPVMQEHNQNCSQQT